ncbi:MAG TPA: septation regulator SpoVG [Bacillota bacterium]
MQITDVRLRRITGDERVRAVASITIDDAFAVHDLRVVEGDKGLFVSMPSRRRLSGDYYDVAHPVTAEARQQVQQAVLEAYGREIREVAVQSR